MRIAVLGGSSPFTIEFINQLYERAIVEKMQPMHILLHGRDIKVLKLIEEYGKKKLENLGWTIESSTDIQQILSGADLVMYQIRFGGLEGRKDDEILAMKYGFPPDETLGPSGLQAAIRMTILQKKIVQNILEYCPNALIVCLTNPLSICVHFMKYSGINNVVGLCELPDYTIKKIADLLNINPKEIEWDYLGLNHRGFIYNLKSNGVDIFEDFYNHINNGAFEGIKKEIIARMRVIPLKHFKLFFEDTKTYSYRSNAVELIRNEVINSLNSSSDLNTILSKRYMAWYSDSVIPFIEAFQNNTGKEMVVNYMIDNHVIETKAKIFKNEIRILKNEKDAPSEVDLWVNRFIEHEEAVIRACVDFKEELIVDAISKDPLLRPDSDIRMIANDIYTYNLKYIKENDKS